MNWLSLKSFLFGTLLCAGLCAVAALAQTPAYQLIRTVLGTELVQIQSPTNVTAGITWTSTSNLRDGRDYAQSSPGTGATITMAANQSVLPLTPAGGLSTLAVVLPPTKDDGKTVTIFSTQAVTTLTLSTSNGATIANAVTSLSANVGVSYVYALASTTWYRFQ